MRKNENDERGSLHRSVRQGGSAVSLLPIMAAVFIAFLVIGIAMQPEYYGCFWTRVATTWISACLGCASFGM
jgi:hypothetical protein